MASKVFRVLIADLLDAESPRLRGLDADHVRVLAEADWPLPPITVHHTTMRVVDGMHRVAAARLTGLVHIDATFISCPAEDLFRLSVEANVAHGLPLSLADRRVAAARLIRSHPALSDRSIARSVGLAAATVAAIRGKIEGARDVKVRVGADGRIRPCLATDGRLTAVRIIAARPGASLREIAREAGISVGTAQDVRKRLQDGQEPVPSGRPVALAPAPGAQARPTTSADLAVLLNVLRCDPALRYSDSGRGLIRWLDQHVMTMEQCSEKAEAVPPHCADRVMQIARHCATTWTALADAMDIARRSEQAEISTRPFH